MIDTNPWAGARPMASRDARRARLSDARGIGEPGPLERRVLSASPRHGSHPRRDFIHPSPTARRRRRRRLGGERGAGFTRGRKRGCARRRGRFFNFAESAAEISRDSLIADDFLSRFSFDDPRPRRALFHPISGVSPIRRINLSLSPALSLSLS